MPTINRPLIGVNNNDEHYEVLVKGKQKWLEPWYFRNYALTPVGSNVGVQWEEGGPMVW